MPDITMCDNKECEKRSECWRFTATPNPYRQAYFDPAPVGECEHFMSNEGRKY